MCKPSKYLVVTISYLSTYIWDLFSFDIIGYKGETIYKLSWGFIHNWVITGIIIQWMVCLVGAKGSLWPTCKLSPCSMISPCYEAPIVPELHSTHLLQGIYLSRLVQHLSQQDTFAPCFYSYYYYICQHFITPDALVCGPVFAIGFIRTSKSPLSYPLLKGE